MEFKYSMLFDFASAPESSVAPVRTGGWSESVYFSSFSSSDLNDFKRLCQKRAGLLPAQAAVIGQRVQQVDPDPGDAQTFAFRYPGNSSYKTDVPQMALHCRMGTGSRNVRSIDLRCVPDSLVVGGEYKPDGIWDPLLDNYRDELDGWHMRGRALDATQVEIDSISAGGEFILRDGMGFSIGTRADVLRSFDAFGNRYGVNNARISAASGSSTGTIYWPSGVATRGGRFRIHTILYPILTKTRFAVSRVMVKKIGRSFFAYRGRR